MQPALYLYGTGRYSYVSTSTVPVNLLLACDLPKNGNLRGAKACREAGGKGTPDGRMNGPDTGKRDRTLYRTFTALHLV